MLDGVGLCGCFESMQPAQYLQKSARERPRHGRTGQHTLMQTPCNQSTRTVGTRHNSIIKIAPSRHDRCRRASSWRMRCVTNPPLSVSAVLGGSSLPPHCVRASMGGVFLLGVMFLPVAVHYSPAPVGPVGVATCLGRLDTVVKYLDSNRPGPLVSGDWISTRYPGRTPSLYPPGPPSPSLNSHLHLGLLASPSGGLGRLGRNHIPTAPPDLHSGPPPLHLSYRTGL